MNALKRYRIEQIVIAVVTVAVAAVVTTFGLINGFWDTFSILAAVLSALVVFMLGGNLLWLHRMRVDVILTRRCDVVGYAQVCDRLFGRSKRESVEKERAIRNFCIAFYQGEFEESVRLFGEIDVAEVADQPELFAYLAYAGYRTDRDSVMLYAEREGEKSIAGKKRRSVVEDLAAGVLRYVRAMREERYRDAIAAVPPRRIGAGNRYFGVFARYCFACAESALGRDEIARTVFAEIAKAGNTLCFARFAAKKQDESVALPEQEKPIPEKENPSDDFTGR